jgi:hypothetical protein
MNRVLFFILNSHKDILAAIPVIFQSVMQNWFVNTEGIDCDSIVLGYSNVITNRLHFLIGGYDI